MDSPRTPNIVSSAIEGVTRTWKQEAEERRRISKLDPVADTLEYCAGEIVARLRSVEESPLRFTVEQFASRNSVTPQTVRNWIRAERIAAIDTPKGYLIDANQIAPLRRAS